MLMIIVFQGMNLPVPPVVDYATAVDENWHGAHKDKELRHIGVIVAKTGHDRGQKEMYLYSPTVKRHDGRIVCSNDFLIFEVGDWILFHVLVQPSKQEVYFGGKKWSNPLFPTAIQFDYPKVVVRACIYPESAYNALVSRQQTHRCWSPDLGDLFIDNVKTFRGDPNSEKARMMNKFLRDPHHLYYVVADYHFNASVFQDLGGPEEEKKVYWRISEVQAMVEKVEDIVDWARAPWGKEVAKYLEHKRERQNNFSNAVPPWYIRSTKVLTFQMLETWEEEVKECFGKYDENDHPVPYLYNEDGTRKPAHPSEIFGILKAKQKKSEEETQLPDPLHPFKSKNSWKKVMSFDGQMLEPGSLLPPVSTARKQKVPGKVELVQDSAGLFMNDAAALSYVEIKKKGTDKLWTTGGWKKPGEAWDSETATANVRVEKNSTKAVNLVRPDMIPCGTGPVRSKNILGIMKPPAKRAVEAKEAPQSSQRSSTPPPPPPSNDRPIRVPVDDSPPPSLPPTAQRSFATASKLVTDRDSDDLSDEAEGCIDVKLLNDEGRELFVKYTNHKKYVKEAEIEARKEPQIKGFTAIQYIEWNKEVIALIEMLIELGCVRNEAKQRVTHYQEGVTRIEKRLAKGEVRETDLVEIHLSKEDDADAKEDLIAHVEIQKRRLAETKKRLIEMQRESTC